MRLLARAEDCWFEPRSTAPMAAFRIALGAIVVVWTLTLAPDLFDFFGPTAIAPPAAGGDGIWSVIGMAPGAPAVAALWAALLGSAAAVLVGWRTRVASLVMLVALISFSRLGPWVYNSGDAMLRVLAFHLVLMPAGDAWSLDARRRHGTAWWVGERAPWGLWLLRVQVAVLYLATAIAKMPGETWGDGSAVALALRLDDLVRIPVPDVLLASAVLVNLLTFATLAFEFTAGVLVWPRATRRWVLLFGVALHLSIDLTLQVGPFSWAILASYLAFADPRWLEVRALRWRLRRRAPALA